MLFIKPGSARLFLSPPQIACPDSSVDMKRNIWGSHRRYYYHLQFRLSATTPPQGSRTAVTLSLAKCLSGVSASIRQPFRVLFTTQHLRSLDL